MSAQQHEPDWGQGPADPTAYARVLVPAQEPEDDFSDLDDLDSFEPGFPSQDPRPTSADDVVDDEAEPEQGDAVADPTGASAPAVDAPAAAPDLKKGIRTTEFWQTLLTQLLAFGVSVAALFGSTVDSTTLQALVPTAALFASAGATAYYSFSRSKVKAAHASTVTPTSAGTA